MASNSWGRQTQSSSTEQAFIACLNLQAIRISKEGHNNFFYGFCSYPPSPASQYIGKTSVCLTLQTKSEIYIPRHETARPRSQFPHACIRERFIYSLDRSTYSAAAKQADRSWEYINRWQIHEWRNWERGRAVSFLGIFVSNFLYSVFAVYRKKKDERVGSHCHCVRGLCIKRVNCNGI
jgi:hypothetical protein